MSELSNGMDDIDEVLRQILESTQDADRALDASDIAEFRRVIGDIRMEAQALQLRMESMGDRLRKVEAAAMERIFGTS